MMPCDRAIPIAFCTKPYSAVVIFPCLKFVGETLRNLDDRTLRFARVCVLLCGVFCVRRCRLARRGEACWKAAQFSCWLKIR